MFYLSHFWIKPETVYFLFGKQALIELSKVISIHLKALH